MSQLSADVLSQAINSEIHARDLYRRLAEKLTIEASRQIMEQLSAEEEQHRQILSNRYRSLFSEDFQPNPKGPKGPDFSLLQSSTFAYTDLFEVIRLAIGAESEAATFYSRQLSSASDPEEVKMLKTLVRFEKGHRKKLERELRRLTKKYS
jgi:rubrerythrin